MKALFTRLRDWPSAMRQRAPAGCRSRLSWGHLAELAVVVLWAMWVGRAYLSLDPKVWPWGREFDIVLQSEFVWTLLPQCGDCVLWNGFANGGSPAFVDMHGVVLHSIVVITTLLWGPINGAKITIVASLALAGLVQWWLAKALGLGRVARVWCASSKGASQSRVVLPPPRASISCWVGTERMGVEAETCLT